jgi:hypothetical protein
MKQDLCRVCEKDRKQDLVQGLTGGKEEGYGHHLKRGKDQDLV